MSLYLCDSCAILCKCEIPDECDFTPKVCLAQLSVRYYEPNWHKEESGEE